MRIEITRSGGFGGITRSWTLEVSRTEAEQRWLPLAEAEAGTAAVVGEAGPHGAAAGGTSGTEGDAGAVDAAAQSSDEPARGPGHQRDRFTYRISVGYTEVVVSESHLDDSWRELIERARTEGSGVAGHGAP